MTEDLDGLSTVIANVHPVEGFTAFISSTPRSPGLASLKGHVSLHKIAFEEGSVIPAIWTFHAITEPDPSIGVTQAVFDNAENAGRLYYISTEVGGQTKYMNIGAASMSLADSPKPVRVVAGTGDYAGQVMIRPAKGTANDTYRLNLKSGDPTKYFQGSNYQGESGINQNDWMTLYCATEEEFIAEDERNFASKVSVSALQDGDEIVIYRSAWDPDANKYVQLAINGEGEMILLTDEGGTVGWYTERNLATGELVSSIKWRFVMGYNTDGTPSGYYWLQNVDTGAYLTPRGLYDFDGNKLYDIILPGTDASGAPIVAGTSASFDYSVQLPGRDAGEFISSIAAWSRMDGTEGLRLIDDPDHVYGYAISKCLYGDADYFNFAKTIEDSTNILTKETLDSTAMGVQIKMYDYSTLAYMSDIIGSRSLKGITFQDEVTTWFVPNLLERTLDADGLPVSAATGQPLTGLFGSDIAIDANHLFLESVYNETGYFEYNSAQNYAYFNYDTEHTLDGAQTGDFTVYDQLGAPVGNGVHVRSHGHFMPYSRLLDDIWTEKNTMDMFRRELPIDDPRYGEDVHKIETDEDAEGGYNYAFGMSIETTFMQTLSKYDSFGNESILEFTGDDDLWVFIDGVLIMDLGGIHSAVSGKINFTTGQITYDGFVPKELVDPSAPSSKASYRTVTDMPTTIRECFERAGVLPDGSPWDPQKAEIQFDGDTLASGYRGHTMKLFYMERGGNASNIRTRFNLRPIRSDSILIGKEVSGTRKQGYIDEVFAFQAFKEDGTPLTEAEKASLSQTGEWRGTGEALEFSTIEIGGQTYDNVFFLRHGEGAYFKLDDAERYYAREIAVDPDVIGTVKVNGEVATTSASPLISPNAGDPDLEDVTSAVDTAANRREMTFDNEARSQSLFITKELSLLAGQRPDPDLTFQFRVKIGPDTTDLRNYSVMPYYIKHTVGGVEKYCVKIDGKMVDLDQHPDGNYYYIGTDGLEHVIPHRDATDPVFDYSSQTGYIDYVPAGYTVEIRGMLPSMAFSVEETSIPQGYELVSIADGSPTSFTPQPSPSASAIAGTMLSETDAEVDVVNRYAEGTFRLRKVSAEDAAQVLGGAEFTLYNEPPEYVDGALRFHSYDAVATFTSDADGFLRVTGEGYYGAPVGSADLVLAAGTYYLKEDKAPPGYSLAHPVSSFWIDDSGMLHINGLVEWDAANQQIIFTSQDNLEIGEDTTLGGVVLQTGMISNIVLVETEMPMTGGAGLGPIAIASLSLLATAVVCRWISRSGNRKARRGRR